MVDLYPDNLAGWPVQAHRNVLSVLLVTVLNWQSASSWPTDQVSVRCPSVCLVSSLLLVATSHLTVLCLDCGSGNVEAFPGLHLVRVRHGQSRQPKD